MRSLYQILKEIQIKEGELRLNSEEKETLRIYIHQLEQLIARIKELL